MNVGHRGKEIYKSTIRKLKFCGTFWKNESHVPNRTDSYYYSVELFEKRNPICPTAGTVWKKTGFKDAAKAKIIAQQTNKNARTK